jgi:MFS family permease
MLINCQDHQENTNLKTSYIKGLFAVCMTGFTQEYFTPFFLLIGGSAQQVGVLNALSNLFSSLIQSLSADATHKIQSRKNVISLFILCQTLTLAAMGVISFLQWKLPLLFMTVAILFATFGAAVIPCWLSWLSDLVRPQRRGEYFGWRARNLGMATIIISLLTGLLLDHMTDIHIYLGFTIIFTAAFATRFLSWLILHKIKEPPLCYSREDQFSFWEFLKRHKNSNFVRFVFFVATLNFSVNLSAPFFAPFMLENLSFNYLIYTIINTSAPLTLYLVIRRWGRHADIVGNLKVIKIISPLFGLVPLLWVLNHHPIYLIVVEIFAGFLWAGFNLCTSNFIIDAVTPEKRTRCLSYFTLVNGVALFAGALIGGGLLSILPPVRGHKILTLFIISGILRFIVGFFLSASVKEVRHVKSVSSQALLFSMIGVKPFIGIDRKPLQI